MHYRLCPKCGHQPLPADQSLPAACPGCGLILAKYSTRAPAGRRPSRLGGLAAGLAQRLLEMPERVEPLEFWGRAAALAFFAVWGWRLALLDVGNGEIGGSFVHNILLPFHEAGHVIFRPFGRFISYLGGTLGQLLMPVVLGVALIRERRDNFGASLALWLLGVSLLDVAPYMYDALDPQLMLLSGMTGKDGDHDWIYLLGSTGMLRQAQTLGRATRWLGVATMLCANGWGAYLLWRQYRRLSDAD